MKARTKILSIAACASVMSLSGCSWLTIGHEDFACSGMPGDTRCMNTGDMYEYSLTNPPSSNTVLSGSGAATNLVSENGDMVLSAPDSKITKKANGDVEVEGNVIVGNDVIVQNYVVPKLPYSPVPVRTPAMVMRIWIAPYTDINGDLNAPGYVYTEIEARKWIVNPSEAQQYRNLFQPLIKKPVVSDQPATYSAGAAQTGGGGGKVNNIELLKQKRGG